MKALLSQEIFASIRYRKNLFESGKCYLHFYLKSCQCCHENFTTFLFTYIIKISQHMLNLLGMERNLRFLILKVTLKSTHQKYWNKYQNQLPLKNDRHSQKTVCNLVIKQVKILWSKSNEFYLNLNPLLWQKVWPQFFCFSSLRWQKSINFIYIHLRTYGDREVYTWNLKI